MKAGEEGGESIEPPVRFPGLAVLACGLMAFLFLLAGCLELRVVDALMREGQSLAGWLLTAAAAFAGLAFFVVILARLSLWVTIFFGPGSTSLLLLSLWLLVLFVWELWTTHSLHVLTPLMFSKFCCVWLFMRFWVVRRKRAAWREGGRLRSGEFFVCRRLLVACWLLACLGFALALVSADPVRAMSAAESLVLLGVMFVLFMVFVRNPLAHPRSALDPAAGVLLVDRD